jgi:hypothetical protein
MRCSKLHLYSITSFSAGDQGRWNLYPHFPRRSLSLARILLVAEPEDPMDW